MKSEQCCGIDARAKLRDTSRIQKKRGESENKAIDGGEIRGALARAIGDQQLVLEEQRLGGDGACTTSAHEFGDDDDEVNRADEEVAHGANASTASIESKTAIGHIAR